MNDFRQNTLDLSTPPTRLERRAEAALDLILALVIGLALAAVLAAWWL